MKSASFECKGQTVMIAIEMENEEAAQDFLERILASARKTSEVNIRIWFGEEIKEH